MSEADEKLMKVFVVYEHFDVMRSGRRLIDKL